MTDVTSSPSPSPQRNPLAILGTILLRVIVPLWILAGATFKLIEATPAMLPREMLKDAHRLGIDLDWLLAALISLEFLAVLVIVLLGRVSRVTAGFMLAVFCIVVIREIAAGNTSCGCFGSKSPPPVAMLVVDGLMLLGIIFLKPLRFAKMDNRFWPPITVAVLFVALTLLTFNHLIPRGPAVAVAVPDAPVATDEPGTSTPPPTQTDPATFTPLPPPSYWFSSEVEAWVGQRWQELELMRFMDPPPDGLDEGIDYVVFYGRTCEHCETMFKEDLGPNPGLARQVVAIEVPSDTEVMTSPDGWPMPATECRQAALPLGVNWIITTPLALRIEDGVVQCAQEAPHERCLGLPEE